MEFHGPGIPDSRIMQIKGDPVAGCHFTPDSQRVPYYARSRVADPGRITRISGMPFAIDLDIIRMDFIENLLNHFRSCVDTYSLVGGIGVEVKMDTEETLVAAESLLTA
jgi:hypothetical protein